MPIDVAPPHLVSSCAFIQNFGGNLGGALAPPITGLLISQTGGFMVPLLFTAVVGLVGESDVAIDAGFQSSLSPRHLPVCSTGHHQSASTGSANT
jgi:hypothetical protein